MLGLSITAIGMRSIDQCLDIFQALREPMQLQYLELAIGSPCGVEVDYGEIPLILHDACLYQDRMRLRLNPLLPKTWQTYAAFIADHHVQAVSLHPPLQRDCERSQLETALAQMEKTLAGACISGSYALPRILVFQLRYDCESSPAGGCVPCVDLASWRSRTNPGNLFISA
ncbi:hypothetical protein K9N68_33370 [Kovacikia minuta CCNUW1]|uniref:hypothetical protein n=1 Tax=Kovacikia minuta TaxID=2931930 RepID=UPI001CCEF17B|nr:hypothetical protein [Kovacikia minuta]UBF26336.1 hypothetical protein K9N68_33370 [Kovacikia minuta CCNUW1]